MKRVVVALTVFGGFSFSASADPVTVNQRPKMQMMGGAGLATMGDKDSGIMNPASLADVERTDWQIFPLLFEFPFDIDALNAGLDYRDDRDKEEATAKASLDKFLGEVSSSSNRARINLYPSYTRKYMHFGVLFDATLDSDFRLNGFGANQLADSGNTAIIAGPVASGAYPFFRNKLQVGGTIRPMAINAPFVNDEQRILDIASGRDSGESIGDNLLGDDPANRTTFGVGVDLGVKYYLEAYGDKGGWKNFVDQWKPTVGITWHDVGDTRFFSSDRTPGNIEQSISVGMAVHPRWKFVQTSIAFDFRSINQPQALLNKVHAGFDVVLWKLWAIRGGFSQGYFTGGMGLDLPFFELDAYVTAQEAGEYANIDSQRTVGVRLSATL